MLDNRNLPNGLIKFFSSLHKPEDSMTSGDSNRTQKDEKIKDILNFMLSIKGIYKVKLLNEQEKRYILELEEQAEKKVLMGLMPGVNQGVRDALSRNFTAAAITQNEFEWPKKGLIRIVHDNEILGEDVRDQEELEKLKRKGYKVIANYIVIYKYDRLKKLGGFKNTTLVVASLDLAWTREVPHSCRVVVGSPSLPADIFIKKIMGIETESGFGSILVGFDLIL